MKTGILFVALLAVSTTALAKHPRNLQLIESGATYVLAEAYVAKEKAATFTLKPGTYVARFEDAKALYLIGEADCLEMHVVPPKQPEAAYTMPFNCGVQYPKEEGGQATFFSIRGALPHNAQMGPLINAIIKSGEGSFQYPISAKAVGDLRPKLVVAQP